jgi:hypothetical protein
MVNSTALQLCGDFDDHALMVAQAIFHSTLGVCPERQRRLQFPQTGGSEFDRLGTLILSVGQPNKPQAFQNPQVSAERASVQLNDIGKLRHRRCISLANSPKQPEHGDFQARRLQRIVVKFCRRESYLTQTGA